MLFLGEVDRGAGTRGADVVQAGQMIRVGMGDDADSPIGCVGIAGKMFSQKHRPVGSDGCL